MGKVVFLAIIAVLLVAIAVPCFTFYLLLKDNWAESASLRQDLLECQLTTPTLQVLSQFNHLLQSRDGVHSHQVEFRQFLQNLSPTELITYQSKSQPFTSSISSISNTATPNDGDAPTSYDLFSDGISNKAFLKNQLGLDNFKYARTNGNIDTRLPNANEYNKEDLSYYNVYNINSRILKNMERSFSNSVTKLKEKQSRLKHFGNKNIIAHNLAQSRLRRHNHQKQKQTESRSALTDIYDQSSVSSLPINDGQETKSVYDINKSIRQPAIVFNVNKINQSKSRSIRDVTNLSTLANIRQSSNHKYLTAHPSQSSTTTIRVPFGPETRIRGSQIYKDLLNTRLRDETTDSSSTETNPASLQQEYVRLLERQVRDLRARVKSCRSCLSRIERRNSSCGGGLGWRQHRRQEKIMRRRLKKQKKAAKVVTNISPESNGRVYLVAPETSEVSQDIQINKTNEYPRIAREEIPDISPHQARENQRVSTDFRRGFNQKIVRMDEALQQFSETQSAFCKELRDNLGGRLEKRGLELGALSEQVAALVRTSTKQVAMLEMLTSDQVYTGQQNIELNLADLLTLKDSQVRLIRNYHKTTLLPAMISLNALLSDHASAITVLGVDIITKMENLEDAFTTHATRGADALQKLSENVDMFVPKHNNLVMRSQDLAKRFHANSEAFVREIQTRMNNVVKELVVIRVQSQSFVNFNDATYANISTSLNQTEDAVDQFSTKLKEKVSSAKERDMEFRKEFAEETELINARVESGVSRALGTNHQAIGQIEETELEGRRFINAASAAWSEHYLTQEHEMRLDADHLANNLHSYTHHTQNILTGLNNAANTHELVLEEQRMDFQRFVRKRQEALDSQCLAISDWSSLMSSELRRRDEDLHRFLSDNLHYSHSHLTYQDDTNELLMTRLPDGSLFYQPRPTAAASVSPVVDNNTNPVQSQHSLPNPALPPHPVLPALPPPLRSPPPNSSSTNEVFVTGIVNNGSNVNIIPPTIGETSTNTTLLSSPSIDMLTIDKNRLENPTSNIPDLGQDLTIPLLSSSDIKSATATNGSSHVELGDTVGESSNFPTGLDDSFKSATVTQTESIIKITSSSIKNQLEKETTEATFNHIDYNVEDENLEHGSNGRGKVLFDTPKDISYVDTDKITSNTTKYKPSIDRFLNGYIQESELTSPVGNDKSNVLYFKNKIKESESNSNSSKIPSNQTSYVIHGLDSSETEHDEGFIKLRSIIHAAERSILDFQNDIQVSNIYAKLREVDLSQGKTSWLRPNGRFQTGFWDDWSDRQNESKPTKFKGKPLKTVWTPTSLHRSIKKKKYLSSKQVTDNDDKKSSLTSLRNISHRKLRHTNNSKKHIRH